MARGFASGSIFTSQKSRVSCSSISTDTTRPFHAKSASAMRCAESPPTRSRALCSAETPGIREAIRDTTSPPLLAVVRRDDCAPMGVATPRTASVTNRTSMRPSLRPCQSCIIDARRRGMPAKKRSSAKSQNPSAREQLAEYRKKRDFKKTAEPEGGADQEADSEKLQFVIQKHAASHL